MAFISKNIFAENRFLQNSFELCFFYLKDKNVRGSLTRNGAAVLFYYEEKILKTTIQVAGNPYRLYLRA